MNTIAAAALAEQPAVQLSQPRLLEPGLALIRPGRERYRVPAMGAIVIALKPGDTLEIVDVEGGQYAELLCFDQQGRLDLSVIDANPNTDANGLRAILAGDDESAARTWDSIKRRGLNIDAAKALRIFGEDSRAGDSASFQVKAEGESVCVIAAPGQDMRVDGQNPTTDLLAVVTRAVIPAQEELPLPEPLAEPRLEYRIKAGTAKSYEVQKGEFIQVIDICGREASDFQALDRRNLDKGIERAINVTTTRTLMGASYPGPGNFSKFFNRDMVPLVEVIRDTTGRHDTFGLACSSRYYEDQGYFGHPNCTDNFNAEFAQYGMAPRRGWEAVNFFYNTGIDDNNVVYLDDPWSRPGDYVLMEALDDLVCASSACPDDVSATNAWNPTDIHVRVYPAKNKFSKAIAYRMKPDAEAKLTRETGFHPRTSEITRNYVEYKGFWLPTCYQNKGAIDEYWAVRERVGITDLSPLRKFEVLGHDAEALMQWTATRNVRKLGVGQIVYTAMCYEHGGMFDDGTIFRMGDNGFRWIGGDEFGGEWLREQARARGLDRVSVKSSTDQLHNIAVQGPKSRDVLKQIIWTPPTQPSIGELQWFRFTIGRIGDFHGIPVMVSRTGYTGELGFEVWCHPKDAPVVWDTVWKAGEQYDISPFGLDAVDMLRIEAGLIFTPNEFTDETDPFEAGIGFSVAIKTKEDDYLGKEALVRRKASPMRKLVGLELEGNEIAAMGDCVHVGRAQVGTITSATRSPILRKNIALCRMDVTHCEIGTKVEVGKLDGHQKRIPATVTPFPFYDPKKEKVRA